MYTLNEKLIGHRNRMKFNINKLLQIKLVPFTLTEYILPPKKFTFSVKLFSHMYFEL